MNKLLLHKRPKLTELPWLSRLNGKKSSFRKIYVRVHPVYKLLFYYLLKQNKIKSAFVIFRE